VNIRSIRTYTNTINKGRRDIRARRAGQGLTLVETLVAILIFSVILVFIVFIQGTAFSSFNKTQIQSDTYRMAMLAAEHLKKEMQYVQVTEYDLPGTLLKYKVPLTDSNGEMSLLASGLPDWNPSEISLCLESDPDGTRNVTRHQSGWPAKKLFSLGNEGSIVFSMPENKRLDAYITVKVTNQGVKVKESDYSVKLQFYIPNQEI